MFVHKAPLIHDRPYDCRLWTALATVYEAQGDLDNAIKSHERAIQGADRAQMVGILAKLAALHGTLSAELVAQLGGHFDDEAGADGNSPPDGAKQADRDAARHHASRAASWHQQLIALGEADGLGVGELAGSYVAVAEWEMRHVLRRMNAGSTGGSSAGASAGKRRTTSRGGDAQAEEHAHEGDLALASMYPEKVKGTTVPQSDAAQELYRRLKLIEARLAVGL